MKTGIDLFANIRPYIEKYRIEDISDVDGSGVITVHITRMRGLGDRWEEIPRNRLGRGGVEDLVGKVITYEVRENAVGTRLMEMVSVRKPR